MKEKKDILRLDDIHYQIDNQVILDSVSFTLGEGEFKLITGPSGCGKSTLLKIISPDAGAVRQYGLRQSGAALPDPSTVAG